MQKKHPIIAVTGASGAGTTVVQQAFHEIFLRLGINGVFVEGDSFLKYDQEEMCRRIETAEQAQKPVSSYGPELNDFARLEQLFRQYSATGTGQIRRRVNHDNQHEFDQPLGTFTPWQEMPADSDLLFYEGLHGGVVASSWTRRKMSESHNPVVIERRKHANGKGVDVAQYVDLLIGIVPAINLEWIQRIHRDFHCKQETPEEVTRDIIERLQDYIHFIIPQFSLTDINFQRMPVVDTSNPFIAREVPTETESVVVIRFREPRKYNFPLFLKRIPEAFMSRSNTLVIPGGEMRHALDVICAPMIEKFRDNQ
ncbi:MAG: phosphoribulokinase [Gammaproteobacteria bacterium]|nr:phosphoribulokinase [Gammaproteobacteria bacterium]